jgi:hypothetical protein
MKSLKIITIIIFLVLCKGCITSKTQEVRFASRENNVCRTLKGKVVVYAIFVDSKYTSPWTRYDIDSTLDSLHKAMDWIMQKAQINDVNLYIEIDVHETAKGTIPIYNEFSKKTLSATLFKKPFPAGVRDIYRWADRIAAEAGKSLPRDTSSVIRTHNKANDRERLIARLRDIHRTDNIALMYFINNYYKEEISVTFDSNSAAHIEFSIVSFKKPAVMAHEFLHLFGAWDLYITPFDNKKKLIKKKKQAMELFPNEIMAFAYRDIDSLDISQFTRYSIGWEKQLDKRYSNLILGSKLKPLKY